MKNVNIQQAYTAALAVDAAYAMMYPAEQFETALKKLTDDGWELLEQSKDLVGRKGLKCLAFVQRNTKKLLIAFAGTEPAIFGEAWHDVPDAIKTHFLGMMPNKAQAVKAMMSRIAKKLNLNKEGYNITLAGHSLGGTLADLARKIAKSFKNKFLTIDGQEKPTENHIYHFDPTTHIGENLEPWDEEDFSEGPNPTPWKKIHLLPQPSWVSGIAHQSWGDDSSMVMALTLPREQLNLINNFGQGSAWQTLKQAVRNPLKALTQTAYNKTLHWRDHELATHLTTLDLKNSSHPHIPALIEIVKLPTLFTSAITARMSPATAHMISSAKESYNSFGCSNNANELYDGLITSQPLEEDEGDESNKDWQEILFDSTEVGFRSYSEIQKIYQSFYDQQTNAPRQDNIREISPNERQGCYEEDLFTSPPSSKENSAAREESEDASSDSDNTHFVSPYPQEDFSRQNTPPTPTKSDFTTRKESGYTSDYSSLSPSRRDTGMSEVDNPSQVDNPDITSSPAKQQSYSPPPTSPHENGLATRVPSINGDLQRQCTITPDSDKDEDEDNDSGAEAEVNLEPPSIPASRFGSTSISQEFLKLWYQSNKGNHPSNKGNPPSTPTVSEDGYGSDHHRYSPCSDDASSGIGSQPSTCPSTPRSCPSTPSRSFKHDPSPLGGHDSEFASTTDHLAQRDERNLDGDVVKKFFPFSPVESEI